MPTKSLKFICFIFLIRIFSIALKFGFAGTFYLIDFAGSESYDSKSAHQRKGETSPINTSLSELTSVFRAFSEKNYTFRNSILICFPELFEQQHKKF
jgi:hypothetical protein